MVFDSLLSELEALGYEVWTFIIPACSQNAPHRRDRVWIVAHREDVADTPKSNDRSGNPESIDRQIQQSGKCNGSTNVPDTTSQHDDRCGYGTSEICRGQSGQAEIPGSREGKSQPRLGNKNDGLSRWLVRAWGTGEWEEGIPRVATGVKDRVNKLKSLGNAIVPQIVMPIMQAIKEVEV